MPRCTVFGRQIDTQGAPGTLLEVQDLKRLNSQDEITRQSVQWHLKVDRKVKLENFDNNDIKFNLKDHFSSLVFVSSETSVTHIKPCKKYFS